MRLFVASFLSPENMEAYDSLVADVISDVPGTIRPVPSRTQHLTMVFLGDVAEADRPNCVQALECVREIETFRFTLGPARVLFSRRSPRLVCVDLVAESARVASVQQRLYERLSVLLHTPIARPKPPHVTLARFGKRARREAADRVIESFSRKAEAIRTRIDHLTEVQLVQSTLTPDGPVYDRRWGQVLKCNI